MRDSMPRAKALGNNKARGVFECLYLNWHLASMKINVPFLWILPHSLELLAIIIIT